MTTKSEWQDANRELLAEARAKLGEPPTAEEMFRYGRGEMSDAEAERIRELLVAYPEVARIYAEPFPDDPKPGEEGYLSDEEVAASWKDLQERRRAATESGRGRVLSFRYMPTFIAAALAIVFAGLFAQAEMRARRFEAELQQPIVIGEPISLSPNAFRRGPEESPQTVRTDGDAYRFVPVLSEQQLHYPNYKIEIFAKSGRTPIWMTTRVERLHDDTFNVIVRRRFLSHGDYEMRISGRDTNWKLLDQFAFRIPD